MSTNESRTVANGEQNGSRTVARRVPRSDYRANIILDFEAFEYADHQTFTNDFEFFKAFVNSYNGKSIDDYKQVKVDKQRGFEYETARFSAVEKLDIMDYLRRLLKFETRKITTKVTQYYVVSVNKPAIEQEQRKSEFWARKFA